MEGIPTISKQKKKMSLCKKKKVTLRLIIALYGAYSLLYA